MLQKGRCSPSLRMLRRGEGDQPWVRAYEQDPWGPRAGSSRASFNYGRRLFIYIFPEAKLRSMVIFTGSQTLAKNIFNKFSNKMDLTILSGYKLQSMETQPKVRSWDQAHLLGIQLLHDFKPSLRTGEWQYREGKTLGEQETQHLCDFNVYLIS